MLRFVLAPVSIERFLVIEISGDRTAYFRSQIVQLPKTGLQGDRILTGAREAQLDLFGRHFLSLLEPSEVILDEKRGVEFAHGHIVFRARRWNNLVEQLLRRSLPDFAYDSAQLLVGLVDVALVFDFQRRANQGEQRGVEHHRTVLIQRHVHRDQFLDSRRREWHVGNESDGDRTLQATRCGQSLPKPSGGEIFRSSVITSRCLMRPLERDNRFEHRTTNNYVAQHRTRERQRESDEEGHGDVG